MAYLGRTFFRDEWAYEDEQAALKVGTRTLRQEIEV